ncbi:hypothetical protein [Sphingomonas crocodyli]|uniref:Uncharacterized protein n=1 Tax=Sphingomonas crocodyli TaxID=1979270 RepID=A0A437M7T5_9SPHN|nr:hypothetical protein [Sphingomonas crocodyli]RVT93719.1 hypothetical protein EOD43_07590 [Sphingomonas crocodyli]
MTAQPGIHGKRRTFAVSDAVDTLGESLAAIREADGLTWKDVGRVLGRSEDQASQYAKGTAEMGFTSFLLGLREWNGRFGADVLAMIGVKSVPLDSEDMTDNERLAKLLHLAHLLSLTLLDDGKVDDDELQAIGSKALDDAARGIEALRQRLSALRAND